MDNLIWHEKITSMIFCFWRICKQRKQIQNGIFYGIFDYGNKTKRKLTRISKLSSSNMNQTHLYFSFSWFIRTARPKYAQTKNLKQKTVIMDFRFMNGKTNASSEWGKDIFHLIQEHQLWYQNVVGIDSGWSYGWPEVWIDRPNRWSGGRYDWNQVVNLKQMQN